MASIKSRSQAYKLSPQTIRPQNCPCQTPRRAAHTAPEYMSYQLSRLDTLWRRMHHSSVPSELLIASERVYFTLRAMGWELAHLVGKKNVDGGGSRGERDSWSVMWLVPAFVDEGGDDTGHIILAEIMIQMFKEGRYRGKVKNIVVRFGNDWSDWTALQPNGYVKEEGEGGVKIELGVAPGTGGLLMEKLIDTTQGMLPEGCRVVPSELQRRVSRAIKEIVRDGTVVSSFEVERVYRQSTSMKHVVPALRIALMCEGMDMPGAIILLDTSGGGGEGRRKVKHIAVIYREEWPICHHYKACEEKPNVDGLTLLM